MNEVQTHKPKGMFLCFCDFQSLVPPLKHMNRIIPPAFKWTLGLDRMFWKYIFLSQERLFSIFNNDKRRCSAGSVYTVVMAFLQRCYQTRSKVVCGMQSRNGLSCSSHEFQHEMSIDCVFPNLSLNYLFTPLIQHSFSWVIWSKSTIFNWHERWKWYGSINARIAFIWNNGLFL